MHDGLDTQSCISGKLHSSSNSEHAAAPTFIVVDLRTMPRLDEPDATQALNAKLGKLSVWVYVYE